MMPALFEPKRYHTQPSEVMAVTWPGGAANAGPVIDWILSERGHASYHSADEPAGKEFIRFDSYSTSADLMPGEPLVFDGRFFRRYAPSTFQRMFRLAKDD